MMSNRIKTLGKQGIANLQARRRQWLSVREARRIVDAVEQSDGPLTSAMRKRAREDAVERLGNDYHAHWLLAFAALAGEYREGWLPECYYLAHTMPNVNGEAHRLGRIRATNPLFMANADLPDIAYALNGRFLSARLEPLSPTEALTRLKTHAEIVFKSDGSGFSNGVEILATQGLTAPDLIRLGNGVFQPRILPHPDLSRFGSDALATIRLGTVLPATGPAQLRMAYLKLGRQGQKHVVAQNQLRIAIDLHSGHLSDLGYLSNWTRVDRHPDSQADFAGKPIPGFDKAVQMALNLHDKMPLARFICWDFAIDHDERPQFLEWEGGVVSFAEGIQGPCFADLHWDSFH
jgi:hypothetical protein